MIDLVRKRSCAHTFYLVLREPGLSPASLFEAGGGIGASYEIRARWGPGSDRVREGL